MANEIYAFHPSIATLYAILRRQSDGKVWSGSDFETFDDLNIGNYDIPLSSKGGDLYATDWPSTAIAAGTYIYAVYKQAGGSPATTDVSVDGREYVWGGIASAPTGPASATMTLTTARDWVRNAVSDAKDGNRYSDTDIDRAIISAGQEFCRRTKCLKRVDSVSVSAGDEDFPLTGNPLTYGFRPERLIDVFLMGEPDSLKVIDYTDLNAALAEDTTQGTPGAIAFLDAATAQLYPIPDIAYTAKLRFWLQFSDWTPGTSSPDSIILNLPNDYLPAVLNDGAPAILTAPDKKNAFSVAARARFEAYIVGMLSAGTFGARVVYRNSLD
jgi:hypothetical protein